MDSGLERMSAPSGLGGAAVYFDGTSSRRHAVTLAFNGALEINADDNRLAAWPYTDIRRADGPSGTLRLSCLTAPAFARLEIRGAGVAGIVGWSLAAAASIVAVVLFGVPLAADRLTPLIPPALERRLGDVAEGAVKFLFGNKVCSNAPGRTAFNKLVNAIREA